MAIESAEYNFKTIKKGNTFKGQEFRILVNDEPMDLSDCDIMIDFKRGGPTGSSPKRMTVGQGITKADPTDGVFAIDKFEVDWQPGTYHFDVLIKEEDDDYQTYIYGTFPVKQNTTNK